MSAESETRDRLLEAATELFGQRGFKKVTVRDICRVGQANVAAVNYHFGDKLGLYREVMHVAIEAMRGTTEEAREAGKGRPPEEQLRLFIEIFLRRLLTPGHESVHYLIQRELHDPTPALDAIVDQAIRPRMDYLSGVVARMMGCEASHESVLRSVGNIHAQAASYMFNPMVPGHRSVATRLGFEFKPTPAAIQAAADHIATFSIAGVYAVGRLNRSARRPSDRPSSPGGPARSTPARRRRRASPPRRRR